MDAHRRWARIALQVFFTERRGSVVSRCGPKHTSSPAGDDVKRRRKSGLLDHSEWRSPCSRQRESMNNEPPESLAVPTAVIASIIDVAQVTGGANGGER